MLREKYTFYEGIIDFRTSINSPILSVIPVSFPVSARRPLDWTRIFYFEVLSHKNRGPISRTTLSRIAIPHFEPDIYRKIFTLPEVTWLREEYTFPFRSILVKFRNHGGDFQHFFFDFRTLLRNCLITHATVCSKHRTNDESLHIHLLIAHLLRSVTITVAKAGL